jgi:hypothetical protein
MSRRCLSWSFLGALLATAVLVVCARAEEFSMTRCMTTGSGSSSARPTPPQRLASTPSRELACVKAQQAYEARRQAEVIRQANETAERQRRAEEQEARRRIEHAAKDTADQAAKERTGLRREEAERARKAQEVAAAARQRKVRQEAERSQGTEPQQPGAEQFAPGPCVTADLTAKCAMPPDPTLEQIRKSQENAAGVRRGR